MVYTTNQLKERIEPIADKYQLRAVYIFGSYARGEAIDSSDVDILIDRTDSIVEGWVIGGLYEDLCNAIGKKVDMITTDTLDQECTKERTPRFIDRLNDEKTLIYG